MNNFEQLIIIIESKNKDLLDNIFYLYIKMVVNQLFPNLNNKDKNNLLVLSGYLIYKINYLFNIKDINTQYKKNNNRDIKAIILLLLPFIDNEKENIFSEIIDLNQLLYSYVGSSKIPKYIYNEKRSDILPQHFKFGNMLLGLDNEELFINNDKLINELIHHNFISLLETLKIINGHLYVNWVNIIPITNYKESDIYINNKLYEGEYYNVIRNIYYQDIIKVKWLIFIIYNKYVIQYLDEYFDLSIFNDNNNFSIFKNKVIVNKLPLNIWKPIITFMVNNLNLNYIKFKIIVNENDEIEDKDRYIEISDDDIINFLKTIDIKLIWIFLKDSINNFNSTIYAKYLTKNKITFENQSTINLKNIYNIAKTLSHTSSWDIMPNKYILLSDKEKKYFNDRYLNDNFNWINLKKNLDRQNEKLSNNEYFDKIILIKNEWNTIKKDLVWNYLVYAGVLSEFKTDTKIKLDINANYYLTNDKYKNLDYLKTQKWYLFYAMDWIAQINFFHHYLNHRVIYITGATGQGKSTQVPKLLIYALKMIDYNNHGKAICTQPRVAPTTENSSRIAEELGVNLKKKFGNDDLRTNNYYIQFKHANDSHDKNKCHHLTLKIVTDGTLLEEIIKTPDLKHIYDIIIIDEAHEHNTNMDLILTLARKTCLLNNLIKLIIVSATMNEDEPIYRRYYKEINDNLQKVIHPFFNEEFIINNNYLDRRFHISPPGATTQYNITEIYLPVNIYPLNNDEEQNAKIAQQKNYQIIKNICNTSIIGDILLFANGTADIIKAVKYLNEVLPPYVIALPYYAQMNKKYRYKIEKIDIEISKIKTKKENVSLTWNEKYLEDLSVQDGIYKRAVIIATNVAEASITINSLKYVVDNGYAKVNIYDKTIDDTKLIVEKISEASRKQRKGRVGRVNEGTVYYAYMKGGRTDVMPKYKITQEFFGNTFLKLFDNTNIDMVNDKTATFYLIHPFENDFSRNFLNEKLDKIPEENYNILYKNLEEKHLIINNKKTNIVQHVNNISTQIMSSLNDSIILLVAHCYGTLTDVLNIYNMIQLINFQMDNLFIKYENKNNDIILLYEIIKKFNNKFKITYQYKNYLIDNFDSKKNPPKNYPIDVWNRLLELYYNDAELTIDQDTIINENEIKEWCNQHNIKFNIMLDFIYTKNKIENLNFDESYYKNTLTYTSEYERILRPFLYGYPSNIENYTFYYNFKDKQISNNIDIKWTQKTNSNNIIIQNIIKNKYDINHL